MRSRILLIAALATALAVLAAGCGGDSGESAAPAPPAETPAPPGEEPAPPGEEPAPPGEEPAPSEEPSGGEIEPGGILRWGTLTNIDTLNPFNAYSANSYVAFIMLYPVLVQYKEDQTLEGDWAESWETSPDGLVWTFKVKPGQWSDGTPLTAEDGAWTCNTIVQYRDGPTAFLAPFLTHVQECSAPDQETLVITYDAPVANVLSQLQQFFVLPKHLWEAHTGNDGKDLKAYTPASDLPIVSAGPFTITTFEKKGVTIFEKNPGYYGDDPPFVDALGLQYFTNADAMIEAFRAGELDYIEDVPAASIQSLEGDDRFVVSAIPGAENTNFIFNSNPEKPEHRELLDPQVRLAFEHAMNREEIAEVVFGGYAKPTVSLIAPDAGAWMNPNLEAAPYDIDAANALLDELGYTLGSDGVRVTPEGDKMEYEVITPTDANFNINREFEIVKAGLEQIGVRVTQNALDGTTAFEEIGAPDWQYLDFDLAMWDWIGYWDPDFMLSVVTCDQYGGWSDTGYCNPDYDEMYVEQGVTLDPEDRKQIVWEMQEILNEDKPYIQLVNMELLNAWSTAWDGFVPALGGYSKKPWTLPHRVG
jgi:peptide/nickel transport system substrate-binding protein